MDVSHVVLLTSKMYHNCYPFITPRSLGVLEGYYTSSIVYTSARSGYVKKKTNNIDRANRVKSHTDGERMEYLNCKLGSEMHEEHQ